MNFPLATCITGSLVLGSNHPKDIMRRWKTNCENTRPNVLRRPCSSLECLLEGYLVDLGSMSVISSLHGFLAPRVAWPFLDGFPAPGPPLGEAPVIQLLCKPPGIATSEKMLPSSAASRLVPTPHASLYVVWEWYSGNWRPHRTDEAD